MLGIGWPSAEILNRIHDQWEEDQGDPENRNERTRSFLGVSIVSSSPHPFEAFVPGAGRHIEISDQPTFREKIVSFLLIQIFFAKFVRRKNQWIDYAFRWSNARDVFSW